MCRRTEFRHHSHILSHKSHTECSPRYLEVAHSAHLDGPKGLLEDLSVEPLPLDHLEEVGVEGVEVGLDGGALHDEVLRQPGRELGRQLVLKKRSQGQ